MTSTRWPSVPVVLLATCGLAVLLGAGWMLTSGKPTGLSVGGSALLAALPVGYAVACWLPMRLVARRGATVDLEWSVPAVALAARVDAIVLDKDGTVTTGDLRVVSVDPIETDHDRNLRWFAGALEHSSDHPVGRAIARLSTRGRLANVAHTPGLGISGSVDRHPVRVGRPDWIGLDHPDGDGITVAVEVDARALGHITVDDVLREDADASISRLRSLGIAPVLVSGGSDHNTERIASATGIDDARAVAPEKRETVVTELASTGRLVAFVGASAVNAEALSCCDLPICSSTPTRPSGIGLNTLDVAVVASVLSLARSTHSVIRSNRLIGLATPLLGLASAGAGVLTPVTAAVFGLVSALLVVGNSLRLLGAEL